MGLYEYQKKKKMFRKKLAEEIESTREYCARCRASVDSFIYNVTRDKKGGETPYKNSSVARSDEGQHGVA